MDRKSTSNKSASGSKGPGALIESDPVGNEWNGFFLMTKHWISDLKFFADELRFLGSLIDKYFMSMIEGENLEAARLITGNLSKVEKRRETLEARFAKHMQHMTELVENPFPQNTQEYRDEHAILELTMADFVKDLRGLKTEIFQLTEKIIESEKARHLLGR